MIRLPHILATFLLFAENTDFILANTSFRRNFTQWTHKLVRKPLKTAKIEVTYYTTSSIGCASACMWSTKVEPAPSFNFEQDHGRCHCNNALDDTEEEQDQPEVTYGILLPDGQIHKETSPDNVYQPDCYAYYTDGSLNNGQYKIQPSRNGPAKDVFCDMTNGGWTNILIILGVNIVHDRTTLNRSLTDYVNGFDIGNGGHWIGLETFHQLTRQYSKLRVISSVMGDNGTPFLAFYSKVTIGDAASNYTLNVDGFEGNCGDALSSHNGLPFSVPIGDNECAKTCTSGWWYGSDGNCGKAILTRMQYSDSNSCPMWETCSTWDNNIPISILTIAVKPV